MHIKQYKEFKGTRNIALESFKIVSLENFEEWRIVMARCGDWSEEKGQFGANVIKKASVNKRKRIAVKENPYKSQINPEEGLKSSMTRTVAMLQIRRQCSNLYPSHLLESARREGVRYVPITMGMSERKESHLLNTILSPL
ncbi:unnamed protein product [Leptosia nina]|uniref:Uncharacterized protein n=1 Tax=Leptosia nina TaxID=320188 RepID=A0AAV1IUC7_9NEOP